MDGMRIRPLRRRRWLGACFALFLAAAIAAATPSIVAVGDVHGDLAALKTILVEAGVLDASGAWVGGETVLVQVGDLIDRGPSMRGTLDFVMALEQAAPKHGGRVVSVLGNHEIMNITGDLRYVAPANYAEFADAGSEKRRAEAWLQVRDLRKQRARKLGQAEPPSGSQERQAWLEAHPAGFLEHQAAFGPDGTYGRWLRARPACFVAQGTAFLHGGLAPAFARVSLEEIDRRVHQDLATFDSYKRLFVAQELILVFFDLPETIRAVREELKALVDAEAASRAATTETGKTYTTRAADAERRKTYERFLDWYGWTINSPDGPFWFRGYSQWSDAEGDAEMPRLLAAAGVQRFVVGHTVQENGRIRVRFGGAVFLIDTGMLSSYFIGGRGSALEIAGGTVSAIYPSEPRQAIWRSPPRMVATATPRARVFLGPDGSPLPFADDAELLEFLREARVVEAQAIGEGITRPRRLTLERNGVRARAIFRNVHTEYSLARLPDGKLELPFRDFFGFEPAAYRLGLLLGVDNIPPATLRRLKGDPGSVQVWIERAMTEQRRREAKSEPPEKLDWQRHLQARMVWDALIGNSDRNQGNTLYAPGWQMWLIDHTRSFRSGVDLPGAENIVWCERGFWQKLRTVGDAEIITSVGESLKSAEISGLLERRRKLVDLIDTLIKERGERAVLFDWSP
ncbi:MAG TPA: metallophosphoesterase [Thermoanaerobaculia bacterium]